MKSLHVVKILLSYCAFAVFWLSGCKSISTAMPAPTTFLTTTATPRPVTPPPTTVPPTATPTPNPSFTPFAPIPTLATRQPNAVAFVAGNSIADKRDVIWLANGSGEKPLPQNVGKNISQLAWAPDGQFLAVNGDGNLWLVATDTDWQYQVTLAEAGIIGSLARAPDGQTIAFMRDLGREHEYSIGLLDTKTYSITYIATVYRASVSLTLRKYAEADLGIPYFGQLSIFDFATKQIVPITNPHWIKRVAFIESGMP